MQPKHFIQQQSIDCVLAKHMMLQIKKEEELRKADFFFKSLIPAPANSTATRTESWPMHDTSRVFFGCSLFLILFFSYMRSELFLVN
jgi:hypothetical protein